MAELTPTAACCSPIAQETCCDPSEKPACCGAGHAAGTCGCSEAGASSSDIRETVRAKYAEAAAAAAAGSLPSCSPADTTPGVFGAELYGEEAGGADVSASLGCGVPTAVADLHEGETVLDLGSGAGGDVLISARRVGPSGRAIGLDMTDEMLELARLSAAEAGVENAEFIKGIWRTCR